MRLGKKLALRVSARGPCEPRCGDAGRNRDARPFPKAVRSRNAASSETKRKGCSGGMEGGAGGETQFPITRPPSPVRRTHLQTRKIDLRQALRELAGHDSKALAAFRLSPAPAASAAFALHAPSKGQFPSRSTPSLEAQLSRFGRASHFEPRIRLWATKKPPVSRRLRISDIRKGATNTHCGT